jgi:hypothetical protein
MRSPLLIMMLVVGALLLTSCRQQETPTALDDDALLISVEDSRTGDVTTGESTLVVTVEDSAGNPVTDATVSVRGDMTHAGMSPILRESDDGTNGIYEVPFEWTMGGDWIVDVVVTLPDGSEHQRSFDFTVAADGGMNMDDEN